MLGTKQFILCVCVCVCICSLPEKDPSVFDCSLPFSGGIKPHFCARLSCVNAAHARKPFICTSK